MNRGPIHANPHLGVPRHPAGELHPHHPRGLGGAVVGVEVRIPPDAHLLDQLVHAGDGLHVVLHVPAQHPTYGRPKLKLLIKLSLSPAQRKTKFEKFGSGLVQSYLGF
eukprot:786506-Pyramimonas_sp.AAC.1